MSPWENRLRVKSPIDKVYKNAFYKMENRHAYLSRRIHSLEKRIVQSAAVHNDTTTMLHSKLTFQMYIQLCIVALFVLYINVEWLKEFHLKMMNIIEYQSTCINGLGGNSTCLLALWAN